MKTSSFRSAQITAALSLFVGYSGYYVCRSNLSVATPLLIQEFAGQGLNKEVMGEIASVGVAFYAVGKVVNGVLGDFIGGRKIFILGMVGSVLATLLFSLSTGVALFFVAWAANRLVQSMGWGGLVKVTSNWFSFQSYGKIMGFLSLSFLVGDIIAKLVLGYLMDLGVGWRSLFFLAAALLAAIAISELFFLRDSPQARGFALPPVNPANLFTNDDASNRPTSLKELLLPYFKNTSFLLMLLLSFGLTALREAFNFWLPTYLFESAKMTEGQAAQLSALYPIFGMVSILSMGYLSDVLLKGKRGIIILVASGLIAGVLSLMAAGLAGFYTVLGFHFAHWFVSVRPLLFSGRSYVVGCRRAERRGYSSRIGRCRGVFGRHCGFVGNGLAGAAHRLEKGLYGLGGNSGFHSPDCFGLLPYSRAETTQPIGDCLLLVNF